MAKGTVSGLPGEHLFHFKDIPDDWLKIDVTDILHQNVPLMISVPNADQEVIEQALGLYAMWHSKYVKISS